MKRSRAYRRFRYYVKKRWAKQIWKLTSNFLSDEEIKNQQKHGYDTLNKTPDMLPVLKEAGVVDAGGQGLLCILEGAARVIIENLQIEIKKFNEDGSNIELVAQAYGAFNEQLNKVNEQLKVLPDPASGNYVEHSLENVGLTCSPSWLFFPSSSSFFFF